MLSTFVSGCGGQKKAADEPKQEKIKAGFIYIGVPGDAGWTYTHNQDLNYIFARLKGNF
jgi:basic membrane lipoprotein Med (substrate-binding protein (PBP1-ABC) superfamily)